MQNSLITVYQIIAHTPVWVWLILAVLVWRGLKSTQPREIGLLNLIILPLVLLALSGFNILSSGFSATIIAGLAIGALVGVAAGLQLERRFTAIAIGNGRLRLAGEWTSLFVVLTVFAMRYVKTVAGIIDPALLTNASFLLIVTGISAFSATMLLTRTALRLRLLLAQPAAAASA